MACKCTDENSKPLDKCLGTCGAYVYAESFPEGRVLPTIKEPGEPVAGENGTFHVKYQERDPLQGTMEIIYAQVAKMINERESFAKIDFHKASVKTYMDGFKEGVLFGVNLVDNIS